MKLIQLHINILNQLQQKFKSFLILLNQRKSSIIYNQHLKYILMIYYQLHNVEIFLQMKHFK